MTQGVYNNFDYRALVIIRHAEEIFKSKKGKGEYGTLKDLGDSGLIDPYIS